MEGDFFSGHGKTKELAGKKTYKYDETAMPKMIKDDGLVKPLFIVWNLGI